MTGRLQKPKQRRTETKQENVTTEEKIRQTPDAKNRIVRKQS